MKNWLGAPDWDRWSCCIVWSEPLNMYNSYNYVQRLNTVNNNTNLYFSTHDELLTSGAKIEKLIVSHPALSEPTEIQILYVAYEGWIYSGRWAVRETAIMHKEPFNTELIHRGYLLQRCMECWDLTILHLSTALTTIFSTQIPTQHTRPEWMAKQLQAGRRWEWIRRQKVMLLGW